MGDFLSNITDQKVLDVFENISKCDEGDFDLGKMELDQPLDSIDYGVGVENNKYSLLANVVSIYKGTNPQEIIEIWISDLLREFKKKYNVVSVKNSLLLLDKEQNYNHVIRISYREDYEDMKVYVSPRGIIPLGEQRKIYIIKISFYSGYDEKITLKLKKLIKEEFVEDLKDFFVLIQDFLNVVYVYNRSNPNEMPNIVLPFKLGDNLLEKKASREFGQNVSNKKNSLNEVPIEELIQIEKPNVSFDDIGGLDEIKDEMRLIVLSASNPDIYKKWGTSPPKGVLLTGDPGCGKTLISKAVASQIGCTFYYVKLTDFMSAYISRSAGRLAQVFELAKKNSPALIFFDEFDAIAVKRDKASHEEYQQVVSVLLTSMDGLEENSGVMVIAATNLPDVIDSAVKRPKRFDRLIKVPMPDEKALMQIFNIHALKAQKKANRDLFAGLDINRIINEFKNFSGADVAEIIRRTLEYKIKKEIQTGKQQPPASTEDILFQINNYERRKEKDKLGHVGFV